MAASTLVEMRNKSRGGCGDWGDRRAEEWAALLAERMGGVRGDARGGERGSTCRRYDIRDERDAGRRDT